MQRDVYVKHAPQLNLSKVMMLKLLKQFYGLSKSVDLWFHEYRAFIFNAFSSSTTEGYMYFYCKHYNEESQRAMAVYVDDD